MAVRVLISVLVFFLAIFDGFAQQIDYYKLTKIKHSDGSVETVTSGKGQFITRSGRSAYESDINGYSLPSNGHMLFVRESDGIKEYKGDCYFGYKCTARFYDAKSVLNIVSPNGKTYIFYKSTPPSGQKTSSFIVRDGYNRPGSSTGTSNQVTSPNVQTPNGNSSQNSNSGYNRHEAKCMGCNGTGKCDHCHGSGQVYVNNHYIKCSRCHGSGSCQSCGGVGKIHGNF